MYSYAQPRSVSATALLYLAAALRSAAYRVRAVARRLETRIARQDAAETEAALECESCSAKAGDTRELDGLAHLNVHVLKDIGAPHWLVAHASGEADREHLRWIGLEHR